MDQGRCYHGWTYLPLLRRTAVGSAWDFLQVSDPNQLPWCPFIEELYPLSVKTAGAPSQWGRLCTQVPVCYSRSKIWYIKLSPMQVVSCISFLQGAGNQMEGELDQGFKARRLLWGTYRPDSVPMIHLVDSTLVSRIGIPWSQTSPYVIEAKQACTGPKSIRYVMMWATPLLGPSHRSNG